MKRLAGLLVILVVSTSLYAAGVNEQEIDAEYATKIYSDLSDWVYEFNQIANQVHNTGQEIIRYRKPPAMPGRLDKTMPCPA
jgi:hypothetical protein